MFAYHIINPNVGSRSLSSAVAEVSQSVASVSATRYVEGLQRDGRVLLVFLARRPNRTLDTLLPNPASAPSEQTAAAYFLLTADPAGIAIDPVKFATLVACIDDLCRRAAPATVASIRLTAAYVGLDFADTSTDPSGAVLGKDVYEHARRLRMRTNLVKGLALVATFVAVALLAYVDDGRRAMNQLTEYRQQLAAVHVELNRIQPAGWVVWTVSATPDANPAPATSPTNLATTPALLGKDHPSIPFCWAAAGERALLPSADLAEGARARQHCGALSEAELRVNLAFRRVQGWNMMAVRSSSSQPDTPSQSLHALATQTCKGNDRGCPPSSDLTSHWKRTELRTAARISLLTGFVLPLLLGFIGGCAFVIRRITERTGNWMLDYQDGAQSLVRVLLAMMLGGLLGVVWTGGETVSLGSMTLSLAAAAFFVGFSLEVVFSMIEAMVAGVADKLRAQVAQPAAAAPIGIPIQSGAQRGGPIAGAGGAQP